MSAEPSISVIIPIFNVEKYLDDCLSSIINQSIPFDEVILVNDGSTDHSREICEIYCEKKSNFILVNQNNKGLSEARNAGLQLANSDYVIFVDSDDCVQKDMVYNIKQRLKKTIYDVLYYSATIKYEIEMGESPKYFFRNSKYCERDMKGILYWMESFPENYIVSACMAAYRRGFLKEQDLWFYKGIYFEDNYFCLQVILAAQKVRCISQAFYIRRCRAGAITTSIMTDKKCRDLITMNLLMWKELEKYNIEGKFLIGFVSYNLLHIWDVLSTFSYGEQVANEWDAICQRFVECWYQKYLSTFKSLGDMVAMLVVLRELTKRNRTITLRGKLLKRMDLMEYIAEVRCGIVDWLKVIPFNESNKKIGVYGIGEHTIKMLDVYQRYIGEVKCDLYYIVTNNTENVKNFLGSLLVECAHIPRDTDLIIISSLVYQKEIYQELIKRRVPDHKIQRLYSDKEIYDLTNIDKYLLL